MLPWLSSWPLERSRGETSSGHSSAAPVCLAGAGVGNAASEGPKCYQAPHPHQLFFFIWLKTKANNNKTYSKKKKTPLRPGSFPVEYMHRKPGDDSVFSPSSSLQVLQVIHIFLESDPFK